MRAVNVIGKRILVMAGLFAAALLLAVRAEASSGVIQFSTSAQEIKKGDAFTVVCQVTSQDEFLDAEFTVMYDADVLRFVKGGSKVSGGNGVLHVNSSGNETTTRKKTYSLQFIAEKKGNTTVAAEGEISVTGPEGDAFSVSSNRLMISVTKKKKAGKAADQPAPVVTPEPEKTPKPTKAPEKKPVENPTEEPEKTAEAEQTELPPGVSFHAEKEQGITRLKNSYEFEVMDPSEVRQVPAGYIQTNMEIEGITVPAFTIEDDLDNNYLLLYLKGPSGESVFYQYDRQEKTIQRYTGALTERVNKGAFSQKKSSEYPVSYYVLIGIIVGLTLIILCMLIAMLKMAMKKKDEF